MYYDMSFLKNRPPDTDILQEYFIPCARMPEFVDGLRHTVRAHGANLLNVTIRTVHRDDVTALPYAAQEMFGFVLYFNVKFNDRDNAVLRQTTRDLVDVAEKAGGTYYLPYQLFYSRSSCGGRICFLINRRPPRGNTIPLSCSATGSTRV